MREERGAAGFSRVCRYRLEIASKPRGSKISFVTARIGQGPRRKRFTSPVFQSQHLEVVNRRVAAASSANEDRTERVTPARPWDEAAHHGDAALRTGGRAYQDDLNLSQLAGYTVGGTFTRRGEQTRLVLLPDPIKPFAH